MFYLYYITIIDKITKGSFSDYSSKILKSVMIMIVLVSVCQFTITYEHTTYLSTTTFNLGGARIQHKYIIFLVTSSIFLLFPQTLTDCVPAACSI